MVNKISHYGVTPLELAIEESFANIVWILLDHGANLSNLSLSIRIEMIELLRDNPRRN